MKKHSTLPKKFDGSWVAFWLAAGMLCVGFLAGVPVGAQPHEWTNIQPVDSGNHGPQIRRIIRDLRYPVLGAADSIRVDSFVQGSNLTLLWYFASWCWNCNQELPLLQKLYAQYHARGFRILGIGVYSPGKDLAAFQETHHIIFPIVVGPSRLKDPEIRQQTYHYSLRKLAGDQRTWGTPFNLWIIPGENGTRALYIAAGEIHPKELQQFLETHLP